METEQEKIIKKFVWLSEKYHKLSLLFYELSQSLKIESKRKTLIGFKEHIKSLDLDINKIKSLSKGLQDLSLNDLKGGKKE